MPKKILKEKEIIRIITPPVASTGRDLDLIKLTKCLIKAKKCDWVGGLLGGEFGYGCHFKNNIFEMRPFYWGECDCGFNKELDRKNTRYKKLREHEATCSLMLPNFKHYKSGLEVRWYKWIGRDMKFNKKITNNQWVKIFQECIKSVK